MTEAILLFYFLNHIFEYLTLFMIITSRGMAWPLKKKNCMFSVGIMLWNGCDYQNTLF